MMSDDIIHKIKYFESRHIRKILGINKDQLLHWTLTRRLIKPAIEGVGRGGRSQFTFKNLFFLALIKELSIFGLDLRIIKEIIGLKQLYPPIKISDIGKKECKTKDLDIYDYVKKYSEDKGFKDFVLNISHFGEFEKFKEASGKWFWFIFPADKYFSSSHSGEDYLEKSSLQIFLSQIIRELEEKTGEKFFK